MQKNDNAKFDLAVLSVIQGNEAQLHELLKESPGLIHQRSTQSHRATLLHYVSANGVEDELQQCPPNAVSITEILLDAGAKVDAVAECYGGGPAQTPLSLLVSSVHPFKVGVQVPIAELLVQYGANVNGIDGSGGPIATAVAFGYLPVAIALSKLGAKIDCLQVAAALGDMTEFQHFFKPDGKLIANAGVNQSNIIYSTTDQLQTLSWSLWYACLHNQINIAKQLISKGADINHQGKEGFTALHNASTKGQASLTTFLLDNKASTEIINDYGGTPLDTLCWFTTNIPNSEVDYVKMARLLLVAGARASAVSPFPSGHKELDEAIQPYLDT
jgi:hypothetical protein